MSDKTAGGSLHDVLERHFPLPDNRAEIEAITGIRHRRFVALVLAPTQQLTRGTIRPLVEVLDSLPGGGGLDVFVDRLGEACEEVWRVVSLLREHFDNYATIVPFAASSCASQIAFGADEVMMGEASSLAPIEDVHVRHIDRERGAGNVPVAASDIRYFLDFLRSRLELEGPIPLDSPVLAQLLQRADPVILGATQKATALNRLVTRRCLETHLDVPEHLAKVDHIVDRVCGEYISRSFPITRRDCEGDLGLDVLRPDGELWSAVWTLHGYYQQMFNLEGDWVWHDRHFSVSYDGFIDTPDERRVLVRLTRVDEHGRPLSDKPALSRWVRPESRELKIDEELEL